MIEQLINIHNSIPQFIHHTAISFCCFMLGFYVFSIFKSNIMTATVCMSASILSLGYFIFKESIFFYAIFESFLIFSSCCLISGVFRFSYRPKRKNYVNWIISGRLIFSIVFSSMLIFLDNSIIRNNNEYIDTNSVLLAATFSFFLAAINLYIKNKKNTSK